jgi:hypothetical protein
VTISNQKSVLRGCKINCFLLHYFEVDSTEFLRCEPPRRANEKEERGDNKERQRRRDKGKMKDGTGK